MLKISKKMGYGLMALKYLLEVQNNDPKKLISVREISDQLSIPFDPLAKVLQAMNKNDIVSSTQGTGGGYQLGSKLEELSMAQLNHIIEKKMEKACVDCSCCNLTDTCNVKMPMDTFNQIMMQTLEKIKVIDLLSQDINLEVEE